MASAVCALLVAILGWSLSRPGATLSRSGSIAPGPDGGGVTPGAPTGTPSVLPSVTASPEPSGSSTPAPTTSPPTTTPTPRTAEQVGLLTDSTRSLESIGLPGEYAVANGTYGELSQVIAETAAATKQAATLTVVAGLADADAVAGTW